jgi:Flp pilus assembly protein TadG
VISVLRRSLRRGDGGRDAGAVAIEFAFLMAFVPLVVMVFGIVDYGEIMGQTANLSAVVRGAGEYARGQVVQGKALPQPSDLETLLGVPAAVFSTLSFCTCADSTQVACPGTGDANPCASSPPANGDLRVLKYVAVSGSQTYTPLVSVTWNFPGSVKARTVLRTQ